MDDFDEQLLERLKCGDSEAMGLLYRRYADRAFGFACRFLRSREDAEEVVGAAFLKVFRFARDFRGEGAFSSWLFRIVRNLCLDRLRQPRLIALPLEEADIASSAKEEAERRNRNRAVADALDSLPEDYRSVLILRDIEGLCNREVSGIIGRSEPATKSLHHRARRALRDRLLEFWGEPS